MLTLSSVAIGKKVKLIAFKAGVPLYRHKLLAMGLTPGVTMQVIAKAPFGGPIQLELRGYQLSLRPSECQNIVVEGIYERCREQTISTDPCVCRQSQ